MIARSAVLASLAVVLMQTPTIAGNGDSSWMRTAKYGIFVHYQYRILLGYSIATKPQFPDSSQMTAGQWNRFVDGFDVPGFCSAACGRTSGVLGDLLHRRPLLCLAVPRRTRRSTITPDDAPGEKCGCAET